MTETTILEPGCYIDSHWGHYQSVRIVEIARELGWTPEDVEEVDNYAIAYNETGNCDNADIWYEMVDEAEQYINENHVPDGYWFGHHPDMGDCGVYPIDDEDY